MSVSTTGFAGEIRLISGQYVPSGWALCQGQSLSIAQYPHLFSLIGTKFGGDGVTTFKLPDFSGRAPLGAGAAPDRSPVVVGEAGGAERVELTNGQLPNHTHVASTAVLASTSGATLTHPQGAVPAVAVGEDGRTPVPLYAPFAAADTTLTQCFVQVQPTGLSESVTVRNPYLGLNFIIALKDELQPGLGTFGEIRMSSFDQVPDRVMSEWRLCDGASLPVEGYFKPLFSVVRGAYGYDHAKGTFNLPDLRGRGPVSTGTAPNLSPINWGEAGGAEQVVLTQGQMPNHNHAAMAAAPASTQQAKLTEPKGAVLAVALGEDGRTELPVYAPLAAANTAISSCSVQMQPAGLSEPVTVRSPYLGINFVICVAGAWPGSGIDGYVSEIRIYGGALELIEGTGWLLCDGQSLNLDVWRDLWNTIAREYGGEGGAFKVPDLRGRVPLGVGAAQGLSPVVLAEAGGAEQVVLSGGQLPKHTHVATAAAPATTTRASLSEAPHGVLAATPVHLYAPASAQETMLAESNVQVQMTGLNQPVSVRNPYLGLNFIICGSGLFPG